MAARLLTRRGSERPGGRCSKHLQSKCAWFWDHLTSFMMTRMETAVLIGLAGSNLMLHGGEAHFCAQERFSGAESGVLQKAGGPGAGERGHRRWAGGKLNQSGETSEGQCPKALEN